MKRRTAALSIALTIAACATVATNPEVLPDRLEEAFGRLVTDQLVTRAVANFADSAKPPRECVEPSSGEDDENMGYPSAGLPEPMPEFNQVDWGLMSYAVRNTVYADQIKDDRYPLDSPLVARAIQIGRNHLKDPARLKAAYARHKPTILAVLRVKGVEAPVKQYLVMNVVPYFTDPVTPAMLQLEAAYYQSLIDGAQAFDKREECQKSCASAASDNAAITSCVEARCRPIVEHARDTYEATRDALPEGRKVDFGTFEFMLRRRAEGGQALVEAWGEIVADLQASL